MPRVGEDPRVVECAPADAYARAAGLGQHVLRGLGRGDVAVADDRDFLHRRHDRADAREIHRAGEALGPRAAMHENRRDPGVLQHGGEIGGGEVVLVPTEAHLGRDGNLHRVHHAAHELRRLGELGHHGRPAADADDLLHRAAHVDVHRRDAQRLDQRGGVAHLLRHGAEELHGEQFLRRAGPDELQRPRVLLEQRTGVDEIGGGPVEAADFADDEPEGQVGVARQRREKQIRPQLVWSDAHSGQVAGPPCGCKDANGTPAGRENQRAARARAASAAAPP